MWNVESLFSIDDEATVEAVLAFIFEDDSSKSNDSSVFDDFDLFPYEIQTIEFSNIMLAQPLAKVKLPPGKYEKPVPIITFFDTGATASIINPATLPRSYWQSCFRPFTAANGQK